ncbi:MAG: hypothetical protein PHG82_02855 [Candidatus Gracilibacteria bacterium]|nr:hypothetical protein [Candidatus Gracilibacteria bacterium]
MKKIAALAVLPVIALASCGKTETVKQVTSTPTPSNGNGNQNNTNAQNNSLNPNINTQVTTTAGITTKEFNLSYNLPNGKPLSFNGNLEIENGAIKAVNFPTYDLVNDKSYEVQFAKKMQADLIGKTVKGLQYDGMSGASLTTKAFNDFLNTINK